jgi:hypothetical protein
MVRAWLGFSLVVTLGMPAHGLTPGDVDRAATKAHAGLRTVMGTIAAADAQLQALVAAGPGAFGSAAVGTLLSDALQLVDLLTHVSCQKF